MKKNSVLRLTIENVSSDGNGIARVDGEVIFVPCGAVGDVLEVVITTECAKGESKPTLILK